MLNTGYLDAVFPVGFLQPLFRYYIRGWIFFEDVVLLKSYDLKGEADNGICISICNP